MKVAVTQKLLRNPDVFRLSDLHLVKGDLFVARENFERTLEGIAIPSIDHLAYSLVCSALIHYRRAFDKSGHRRAFLTNKIVRNNAVELYSLHEKLIDLGNKYVAHSENEYEQCLVTVQVSIDEEGQAAFRGLGLQASSIALLSQKDSAESMMLIDRLIDQYLEPEIVRLEGEIASICNSLSSEELKSLPEGFAPPGDANPKTRRSWPHSGKY